MAQKFGEMCITKCRDNSHQAKLSNKGTQHTQVGFVKSHPVSNHGVNNPKARIIILTKDVTFLHKSYRDWNKVEKVGLVLTIYEGSNNDDVVPTSYEGLDDEE